MRIRINLREASSGFTLKEIIERGLHFFESELDEEGLRRLRRKAEGMGRHFFPKELSLEDCQRFLGSERVRGFSCPCEALGYVIVYWAFQWMTGEWEPTVYNFWADWPDMVKEALENFRGE